MNAAKHPIPASSLPSRNQPLRTRSAHASSIRAAHSTEAQTTEDQTTEDRPTQTRRPYQPRRVPFAGARRAIALESSVKLTVNLLLAVVATTTIAKLVPHYQAQQEQLSTLQDSVAQAEKKNAELRDQFSRNFDPAQTSRIMQEQSGMGYPNQKKVIWTEPLD